MSDREPSSEEPSSFDRDTTRHVRSAVAGDADSLTWIVSRFSAALLAQARYRLGRLGQHYEPEDLVQDVWLRLLPRLPDLPSRDGRYTPVLMKFLSTTLLHRINSLVQKHLLGKPSTERDERVEQLPIDATGVVSRAVRSEIADAIHTGIAELPEQDREILVLRGIEQSSNQTVAFTLGIPPNTVAVRYRRALQRLRQRVPGSLFDELG